MLYPQNNNFRHITDLSGFWDIKPDPDNSGEENGWSAGFDSEMVVGVPGSWNEQLAESGLMNYVGKVWYQKRFFHTRADLKQSVFIRIGAADFNARVWLNGTYIGCHNGGFLPFEFNVTNSILVEKENTLIISVDNHLDHDSIPQGLNAGDYAEFGKERELSFPATVFDFFAYGGLSRNVQVYTRSENALTDVGIYTSISGKNGRIDLTLSFDASVMGTLIRLRVLNKGTEILSKEIKPVQDPVSTNFEIPDCRFWCPDDPHLYQLHIVLFQDGQPIDEYFHDIGIREVLVTKDGLLLNGNPVFLKGFGKHEDFAVLGRGLSYPLIVKDFQLMNWIGANSFRTSHYPYAEEVMQLADRMGYLVIDEVPAVSLNFRFISDKTLLQHKQMITELITRDRNHPCVIAWSVANEPGIWGEPEAVSEKAHEYWKTIRAHTLALDDSRPVTMPACAKWGVEDPVYEYSDFISVNRYWGWYEIPGEPEKAGEVLKNELQVIYKKYQKPVMLTEFGADTLEGAHATYPQMFTEEYQTALLQVYFRTIAGLPFMIGEHIWNFADFKTAQHHRRIVLNKKGVFNRERLPKSAAFAVKKHWQKENS